MFAALWLVALSSSSPLPGPNRIETAPAPQPIVGGSVSAPGAWPTVVGIVAGGEICTGTVVAPDLVLTAAHCFARVAQGDQGIVYLGDELYGSASMNMIEFGIHPEFCAESDCGDDRHDFAYMVVDGEMASTPSRPIVRQDEWDQAMDPGAELMLVGYGVDHDEDGNLWGQGPKREVEVELRRLSKDGRVFLAGDDGKDSCAGDSGGPAFVLIDGEWVLAGVLSRGSRPCGGGALYGVPYPALTWLHEQTGYAAPGWSPATAEDLDTSQDEGGGCDVAGGGGSGLALGLLALVRRRRRV